MQHTTIPEPPGFAQPSKAEQVKYLQDQWTELSRARASCRFRKATCNSPRNASLNTGVTLAGLAQHMML